MTDPRQIIVKGDATIRVGVWGEIVDGVKERRGPMISFILPEGNEVCGYAVEIVLRVGGVDDYQSIIGAMQEVVEMIEEGPASAPLVQ